MNGLKSFGRYPTSGAAWRARPSGPDRGLHRAAAYVPANTNTNVGTQASTHWRGISLSAPHVGFDCETLEQRNVKGVPRQGTHKRGNLLSALYLTRYPAGGNGLSFGPWLVTTRKGRKMWGNCIYPNILYYKSMSLREWVPQDIVAMYFFV